MKVQVTKAISKKVITAALISAVSVGGLVGCAEEQNPNKVNLGISFGGYGAQAKLMNFIFPQASAAASDIQLCIGRLRLKPLEETEAVVDNVDFNPGLVTIDAAGTFLGEISIPAMEYRRIEFDLEPDCVGGNSVSFSDGVTTYTAQDTITVKFEGSFNADVAGDLVLGIGHIISAMDTYDGTSDIKVMLEALSGDL